MFYLIREARDCDFCSYQIVDHSEDREILQKKADELNNTIQEYLKVRRQFEDQIQKGWETAKTFVAQKKVPNRKPDLSNREVWETIVKENKYVMDREYQTFREDFVNLKIPERLRDLFLKELDNLWCTKFLVVEQKPVWG